MKNINQPSPSALNPSGTSSRRERGLISFYPKNPSPTGRGEGVRERCDGLHAQKFLLLVILFFVLALVSCSTPTPTEIPPAPTDTSTPTPEPTPTSIYSSLPGAYFGVFNVGTEMEESVDRKFAGQLSYIGWDRAFAGSAAGPNAEKGWITQVTWEYRLTIGGPTDPYIFQPLKSVIDGKQDRYLHQFAADVREFGKPVMLRWGHEMNGDWYPWSGVRNGGATPDKYGDLAKPDGPELFVDAYRHIHDVFQEEGADNVIWVWCPNVAMEGELGAEWNHIKNYYPGDEYVDWLCMDGYNWGTSQGWSKWQTFDEIYAPTYAQLQAINAEKPMMIGEFASSDMGGDKAAWVRDAFKTMFEKYPQIRMATWFSINKETDWRMDSSPEVLDAFKEVLADPRWVEAWPGYEK